MALALARLGLFAACQHSPECLTLWPKYDKLVDIIARYRRLTIYELIHQKLAFRPGGCWEYYGPCTDRDYGMIDYQGRKQFVHRVVYRLMKGKIPEGLLVLHTCDNPKCCNPDHLFIGTHKDNTQDMIKKGRHGWRRL